VSKTDYAPRSGNINENDGERNRLILVKIECIKVDFFSGLIIAVVVANSEGVFIFENISNFHRP
jgi:hypothetical protein